MTMLLLGQTVIGVPSAATRAISARSSAIATPWSIRSAPSSSIAIRMFSGPTPTASPAWHVRRGPESAGRDERRREEPTVVPVIRVDDGMRR